MHNEYNRAMTRLGGTGPVFEHAYITGNPNNAIELAEPQTAPQRAQS